MNVWILLLCVSVFGADEQPSTRKRFLKGAGCLCIALGTCYFLFASSQPQNGEYALVCSQNVQSSVVTCSAISLPSTVSSLATNISKKWKNLWADRTNDNGYISIYDAAANGQTEVVKFFAEHGADLNKADSDGYTPLCVAAAYGQTKVIKFVAEQGADLNKLCRYKQTPVHAAAHLDQIEAVKVLAEHGADLNKVDMKGYTLVYIAALEGHMEVVKFLSEHSANLNKHAAASDGHMEVVKFLSEQGADLNKPNKYGKTPVYFAAKYGQTEVVKFLIESKVKFDKNVLEIAYSKEIKQLIKNQIDFCSIRIGPRNLGQNPTRILISMAFYEQTAQSANYLPHRAYEFGTPDTSGYPSKRSIAKMEKEHI